MVSKDQAMGLPDIYEEMINNLLFDIDFKKKGEKH